MSLIGKRVLLTGATGGLGQALALLLASHGAHLALVGRSRPALETLCGQVRSAGGKALGIESTLFGENVAELLATKAMSEMGGLDILINCAGTLDFTLFSAQQPERIAEIMHVNSVFPMQLTGAVLPYMIEKNAGQIVNIGSIFGSIGFPHYASYSASKFALRGFSQALRRELFDTHIKVSYIAPRAIKTNINNENSVKMMAATKANVDEAHMVAAKVIKTIMSGKHEHYIGQPESFFAWLNGLLPQLVSQGLKKPTQIAREFLK